MKSTLILALLGITTAFVTDSSAFDAGDEAKEEMQMQTQFDEWYVEPAIQREMKSAAAKSAYNYRNVRPAVEG